jgi:hypothetical protein
MSARIESVAQAWDDYYMVVVNPNAKPAQVRACRRAFYAGAQSLLAMIGQGFDPDRGITAADLRHIADVHEELRAFARDLQEGVA